MHLAGYLDFLKYLMDHIIWIFFKHYIGPNCIFRKLSYRPYNILKLKWT